MLDHLNGALNGDVILPTASIGKLYLMLAVLDDVDAGRDGRTGGI